MHEQWSSTLGTAGTMLCHQVVSLEGRRSFPSTRGAGTDISLDCHLTESMSMASGGLLGALHRFILLCNCPGFDILGGLIVGFSRLHTRCFGLVHPSWRLRSCRRARSPSAVVPRLLVVDSLTEHHPLWSSSCARGTNLSSAKSPELVFVVFFLTSVIARGLDTKGKVSGRISPSTREAETSAHVNHLFFPLADTLPPSPSILFPPSSPPSLLHTHIHHHLRCHLSSSRVPVAPSLRQDGIVFGSTRLRCG